MYKVLVFIIVTAFSVNTFAIDSQQMLKEALGRLLFFDTNLSTPVGQSCASCHAPEHAFTDPNKDFPVSEGVHPGRFGNRNAPTLMYMAFSPALYIDEEEGIYVGGQFWDGRANTLEEQIEGPLVNPLEMANVDQAAVVNKVKNAFYQALFKQVYGKDIFKQPGKAFQKISEAIAAFERSAVFSPFSSKYDYYLQGKTALTEQELRGLEIFEAEDKGNCAACHPSRPTVDIPQPLFTDFTYDNLGTPANPLNPFYQQEAQYNPEGEHFIDKGLGTATNDVERDGKFKVPTLRNIAVTAPYMHNGVFKTLREVIEFYNERDVSNRFGPPEVVENVNIEELGDLKLTEQEVLDLVAFMEILTDGYLVE